MSKKPIFALKLSTFVIALAEVVILKVFRFHNTTNTHRTAVRKTVAWWVFSYAKNENVSK
ncbi:hypothetical protein BM529_11090 [Clostridioides difficile]|nr:hypothetical protein BM529_11090 [Clostridioides difficile]OJT84318.1 hypothetical protein BM532_00755 [Clostridioides difficile]PPS73174.1 hypothetical protein AWI46_17245 [Clostridioides difficile]